MNRLLLRTKARLRDALKPVAEAAVGALTIALLRTTRFFDPDKTANFFGRATRFIGRRLREDRIGRENLKAAFPEKTPQRRINAERCTRSRCLRSAFPAMSSGAAPDSGRGPGVQNRELRAEPSATGATVFPAEG